LDTSNTVVGFRTPNFLKGGGKGELVMILMELGVLKVLTIL